LGIDKKVSLIEGGNLMALKHLEGKWYIIESTLKFWKNPSRSLPSITYTVNSGKFLDEICFLENGQECTIKAYDHFVDKSKLEFAHQLKGWRGLFKTKWRVEYFATDHSWAIISFEKSVFDTAGLEIISRSPNLSDELLHEIHSKIQDRGYLKSYIPRLENLVSHSKH
jgi:lipocalin